MATIVTKIARLARQKLGRSAKGGGRNGVPDWDAWYAVRDGASQLGLKGPLLGYVTDAASLTAMTSAYVARYAQAYGPVENVIDAGAHVGSRKPVPVELP